MAERRLTLLSHAHRIPGGSWATSCGTPALALLPFPAMRLVGHKDPLSEKPWHVVPIVQDEAGRFFTVFPQPDGTLTLYPVMDRSKIIWHTRPLEAEFDPLRDSLFAVRPGVVMVYETDSIQRFFAWFVNEPEFALAEPHKRLGWAFVSGDREALIRELERQVAEERPATLAHDWRVLREIHPELPESYGELLEG